MSLDPFNAASTCGPTAEGAADESCRSDLVDHRAKIGDLLFEPRLLVLRDFILVFVTSEHLGYGTVQLRDPRFAALLIGFQLLSHFLDTREHGANRNRSGRSSLWPHMLCP